MPWYGVVAIFAAGGWAFDRLRGAADETGDLALVAGVLTAGYFVARRAKVI